MSCYICTYKRHKCKMRTQRRPVVSGRRTAERRGRAGLGKKGCNLDDLASRPPTCRMQKPDIPLVGRFGAPGGAAGRGRPRLGANRTVRQGKQKVQRTSKGIEKMSLQRLSRSTNNRNLMLTGGGTESAVDTRFLTSSLLVCYRFVVGTNNAICSWLPTS